MDSTRNDPPRSPSIDQHARLPRQQQGPKRVQLSLLQRNNVELAYGYRFPSLQRILGASQKRGETTLGFRPIPELSDPIFDQWRLTSGSQDWL